MRLGEYRIARFQFKFFVVLHRSLISEPFYFKNGWFGIHIFKIIAAIIENYYQYDKINMQIYIIYIYLISI